jgi:hydroxyacylglutathione hydrolase
VQISRRGIQFVFFRQVLYRDLGCASYLLGDGDEAIVIDPRWDIEVYLETARVESLRIVHVLDTHDHADHVSGRERLAAVTGARVHRPVTDGEPDLVLEVGHLRVHTLAAPGHRPEHVVFAVADLTRGPEPWLLLTGDSMLVGDLARPDLAYQPAEGAHAMHRTISQLIALGDHVEVWPGHIGGSLCGGAGLSGKTSSTIGFERRHNPLLALDADSFVSELTASLPTRPPNVEHIVELNRRSGAAPAALLEPLAEDDLVAPVAAGTTILDARSPDDFDRAHLAGSINLPVSSAGVGTRAGWTLSPDQELVLVAADPESAAQMADALQAVGFANLTGFALADHRAWTAAALPVAHADAWDVDRLLAELRADAVELVDVREPSEWVLGHVRGSVNVPLNRLRDVATAGIPDRGRPTAVACAAGVRAAFAASLLRRSGCRDVVRLAEGGVPGLGARGLKLEVGL